MEHVYALGVSCIESIQYWFAGWSGYLELVNHLANPHYVFEILLPLISIIDSVFASQLLLCMAFGGWLNCLMKWLFLEDRPYWWVEETTYYVNSHRPHLHQTAQSCETGPGSPSGHSTTAASVLILAVMWISHILNDRKFDLRWWKMFVYPMFGAALGSVMLARMFVATHFPHQCLLGSLLGLFIGPALCIYVTDPFIWQYGLYSTMAVGQAMLWHACGAALSILSAVLMYYTMYFFEVDPDHTITLARRWCASAAHVHASTAPLFALVQCTANLLGWAVSVTPAVAQYRHYTRNRSLLISIFATGLSIYFLKQLEGNISRTNGVSFYILLFLLNLIKPALFLRVVPALAMWPHSVENKLKVN